MLIIPPRSLSRSINHTRTQTSPPRTAGERVLLELKKEEKWRLFFLSLYFLGCSPVLKQSLLFFPNKFLLQVNLLSNSFLLTSLETLQCGCLQGAGSLTCVSSPARASDCVGLIYVIRKKKNNKKRLSVLGSAGIAVNGLDSCIWLLLIAAVPLIYHLNVQEVHRCTRAHTVITRFIRTYY